MGSVYANLNPEEKLQPNLSNVEIEGETILTSDEEDLIRVLKIEMDELNLDVLKSKYRSFVLKYHPDRGKGLGLSLKEIESRKQFLQKITGAYRSLFTKLK